MATACVASWTGEKFRIADEDGYSAAEAGAFEGRFRWHFATNGDFVVNQLIEMFRD